MNLPIERLLERGVSFLRKVTSDELEPAQARLAAETIAPGSARGDIEVLWTQENYRHTRAYELLIRAEEGSYTLGFHPDRGVPWAFRDIQRHTESHVVEVDGEVLRVEDAVHIIDFTWSNERIGRRLVDACIINRALREAAIDVSDDELQACMDEFRIRRGLLTEDATRSWLRLNGLDHERFEILIADVARVAKLRGQLVGARVQAELAEHRSRYDEVALVHLEFATDEPARVAHDQAREDPAKLLVVAAGLASEAAPHHRPLNPDVLRHARVCRLPSSFRRTVATMSVGEIRRIESEEDGTCHVVGLVGRTEARADARTLEAVQEQLFEDWMEQRRAAANIRWFWGRETPLEPEP